MSRKRSETVVIPLRVPKDVHKAVQRSADKAKLSDADILRMAIERGLPAVDKMFETPDKQAA